jgi:hypothetical protein
LGKLGKHSHIFIGRKISLKKRDRKVFISSAMAILLSVIISTIQITNVSADGTEMLGPPSIPIGSGSGIVVAGTGLVTQPGTIIVNVPGEVVQALLYWEGQMSEFAPAGGSIYLNGIPEPITGTLIGGPKRFF